MQGCSLGRGTSPSEGYDAILPPRDVDNWEGSGVRLPRPSGCDNSLLLVNTAHAFFDRSDLASQTGNQIQNEFMVKVLIIIVVSSLCMVRNSICQDVALDIRALDFHHFDVFKSNTH